MSPVNLFTHYKKKEDHFTNGLVSILQLSKFQDNRFVHNFLNNMNTLSLDVQRDIDTFKVLKDTDTADAELSNDEICCRLETKIVSYAIKKEQIQSHWEKLKQSPQNSKKLVMLTPDDSGSQYVNEFKKLDSNILHLEWKEVYNFFHDYAEGHKGLLSEIIRQYSEKISDEILKKDYVGVILTIAFGEESGVYPDKYLDEMRNGQWTDWRTPSKYRELDGKHRKLLLYDPSRRAITVEVEISEVIRTNEEERFSWSNKFVPEGPEVYENPIAIKNIRKIEGFESFGKGQTAHRNLTHEQYKQLRICNKIT